MMKDAIEVEVNLNASRKKKRDEVEWRRQEGDRIKDKYPQHPSSSISQEARMDIVMKSMERLMERHSMDGRTPPRENQE